MKFLLFFAAIGGWINQHTNVRLCWTLGVYMRLMSGSLSQGRNHGNVWLFSPLQTQMVLSLFAYAQTEFVFT